MEGDFLESMINSYMAASVFKIPFVVRSDYILHTKLIFYINLHKVSISAVTWYVLFFSLPPLFSLPLFQSKSITRKGGRALRHFPYMPHAALIAENLQERLRFPDTSKWIPCVVGAVWGSHDLLLRGPLSLVSAFTSVSQAGPGHWLRQWCVHIPARLGLMLVSLSQERDGLVLGRQDGPESAPDRKFRSEKPFMGRRV